MSEVDGYVMVDTIMKSPRCLCTYVQGTQIGIIRKGNFTLEQLQAHYRVLTEYLDKLVKPYIDSIWVKKRGENKIE